MLHAVTTQVVPEPTHFPLAPTPSSSHLFSLFSNLPPPPPIFPPLTFLFYYPGRQYVLHVCHDVLGGSISMWLL